MPETVAEREKKNEWIKHIYSKRTDIRLPPKLYCGGDLFWSTSEMQTMSRHHHYPQLDLI